MQNLSKQDKKRAQDRAAQRASRSRTKDRVARLELQIAQLQGGADQALLEQVNNMRQERSQLRTLADQLLNIAGAVHTTLVSKDDAPSSGPSARTSLLGDIVRDYEALKTTHPAPIMPLTDPHPILVGVLNGWNAPVADQEEPVHRLMAHLHRNLMLERPLVRPIDQLAILYLMQMSLLILLAQHDTYRVYLGHIPGWLYPMPQLRRHLLSQPDVVNYNTQPCNDFATLTLRSVVFVPELNFEDAYIVGPDHRLTLTPRFRQLFAPTAPVSPFAVSPDFVAQYPTLRGLVPEWQPPDRRSHRSRPEIPQRLIALPSLSPSTDSGACNDRQTPDQQNDDLRDTQAGSSLTPYADLSTSGVGDLTFPSSISVPPASPTHSVFAGEPMGNWYEALGFLAETDSVPAWLLEPVGEKADEL
ncbi:hypothetical protein BO94DRAFT_557731 [Aspergillus sclerotioniger CBS 115572]|uniref:BZIP domain-containing protein n=1 Tax=Aspergillus sclerotioniger CBS 115572 TaxID=1450535 RepID=A0A317WCE9_9EURO|nr:hypothetical protein BO94DRAFT_557731 [Aspergillus sclerotioniger CBS 115572]PWY83909.1 hypothetical protein BO94DRAFT_557731 [Aspergillus sclerotioniger CBS 115572]